MSLDRTPRHLLYRIHEHGQDCSGHGARDAVPEMRQGLGEPGRAGSAALPEVRQGSLAVKLARTCQLGTSGYTDEEARCAGAQWESPRYFVKTKESLYACAKHAQMAMRINPMGPRYRPERMS